MAVIDVPTWQVGLGLAIIGIFSGFGTAAGNYIFTEIVKPWVLKHKEKLKKVKVYI